MKLLTLALILVALTLSACAAARVEPIQVQEHGFVTLNASPPDAQVFLDGHLLGAIRDVTARALFLPHGVYTITIVAPGFKAHREEIRIDSGYPRFMHVVLAPDFVSPR